MPKEYKTSDLLAEILTLIQRERDTVNREIWYHEQTPLEPPARLFETREMLAAGFELISNTHRKYWDNENV